MEHLPRIHHIAVLPRSPRVIVKIECNTRKNTGRIIFMSMFNDISWGSKKTTRKNASQMLNPFLSLQKDSEQDNGHSSDLDQRKRRTLSVKTVHKDIGTKLQRNDVDIRTKRTSSLPSHESFVQRSAHKQRWWKIVDTLLR